MLGSRLTLYRITGYHLATYEIRGRIAGRLVTLLAYYDRAGVTPGETVRIAQSLRWVRR